MGEDEKPDHLQFNVLVGPLMARAPDGLNIEAYERQLDRTQAFIPRLDTKVSAVFAIQAGQIAVASLNLTFGDLKIWWIAAPLAVFLATAAFVIFNLYRCTYPHLKGGNSSLIYFNEIAKLREAEFIQRFGALSTAEFKNDLAAQIWRNAEIACLKYGYLRQATVAAMLSLLPWTGLLLATSLAHWTLPKLQG
jgi:hypothetical protein